MVPSTGGKGETRITISTDKNLDGENREATVVAKVVAGDSEDMLRITQSARTGIIEPEKESVEIGDEGGEVKIPVYANVKYELIFPENQPSWLSVSQQTTEDELVLNIEENPVGKRECRLELRAVDDTTLKAEILIRQSAGGLIKLWAPENAGAQPWGDYYFYGENPCPEGYKVPTLGDFEKLVEYWWLYDDTPENNPGNVQGVWFGVSYDDTRFATVENAESLGCIFFPASGRIGKDSEEVFNQNKAGCYIAEDLEPGSETSIGSLYFISYGLMKATYGRFDTGYRLSVRCIRSDNAKWPPILGPSEE